MKKNFYYLLTAFFCISAVSFAQRGKDGNITVNAANKIVNEYTSLFTDAAAGATTISVTASGLNTNNRFSSNLAPGDLIMIIQMQGASILGQPDNSDPTVSNPNDATWGSITAYNNCGNYELCQVSSVPNATSITINCGLTNDYTAVGKVQVVRIPRYNTLTISAPGVLTCQAWNGSTGGILAVEVYGTTTITSGGKVNVTGKGFRGGALYVTTNNRTQTPWYSSSSTNISANKGEGIAGYDADYTPSGGKFCRGAAANAGGAGNVWNAGGGGGANAGAINTWTGLGVPDASQPGWITAWNLETPGFASTSSSGGGRGGYSFSGSDEDATVQGPDNINWGGYGRGNIGGLGGRPLDYSSGKLFMGGGGGSGDQDNGEGGAGGNGGGIILFTTYHPISGSGADSILANGAAGGDSHTTPPLTSYSGRDGGGGAGGGGTIILSTPNTAGVVLSAKGGNGGNQVLTAGSFYFGAMNEAEGPGGGGGGGYIAVSAGTVTQLVTGGKNGTSNSDGVTEFPPNGATKGGAGLSNQALSWMDTLAASNATICAGDSTLLIATINGVIPPGLTWYSSITGDTIVGTDTLHTHALTTNTTYYAGLCPGIYRIPVTVTILPSTANISITASPSGSVCPGTSITFTATATNAGTNPTYQWLVNSTPVGSGNTIYTSSSLQNNDTVRCILTPTTGCAAGIPVVSDSVVVSISPTLAASVSITASPSNSICSGSTVSFSATGINGGSTPSYQWQLNGSAVSSNNAVFTSNSLTTTDVINCIFTSSATCATGSPATSNSITMFVKPTPTPTFTSDIHSGCHLPLCVNFAVADSSGYAAAVYNFGDGDSAVHFNASHCFTQTGNYSIALTVLDTSGCSGSTTINNMVIVSPQPTANFTYAPTTNILANSEVVFTNASTNNNSSIWNFNNPTSASNISSVESPSHLFNAGGSYCIKLVVENLAGCADSMSQCITVSDEAKLVIPNIFTPNGDGKNDVFLLTTASIKELQCSIYDRWGVKVAEWNKVDGTWDGRTTNGKAVQSGIYYYIITATGSNGTILNKQGYLQLLRD